MCTTSSTSSGWESDSESEEDGPAKQHPSSGGLNQGDRGRRKVNVGVDGGTPLTVWEVKLTPKRQRLRRFWPEPSEQLRAAVSEQPNFPLPHRVPPARLVALASDGKILLAATVEHTLWKLTLQQDQTVAQEQGDAGWICIGAAQNVASMAVHGAWLVALDTRSQLWRLQFYCAGANWEAVVAPRDKVVAIAAACGQLWAATETGRLLSCSDLTNCNDAVDTSTACSSCKGEWLDVREALNVVGLTEAPHTGHLIAACEDMRLYSWNPVSRPSLPWATVGLCPPELLPEHGFIALGVRGGDCSTGRILAAGPTAITACELTVVDGFNVQACPELDANRHLWPLRASRWKDWGLPLP